MFGLVKLVVGAGVGKLLVMDCVLCDVALTVVGKMLVLTPCVVLAVVLVIIVVEVIGVVDVLGNTVVTGTGPVNQC